MLHVKSLSNVPAYTRLTRRGEVTLTSLGSLGLHKVYKSSVGDQGNVEEAQRNLQPYSLHMTQPEQTKDLAT